MRGARASARLAGAKKPAAGLAAACAAAAVIAACGGSATPARTATAGVRAAQRVSASVIADAARRTARIPAFKVTLTADLESDQMQGQASVHAAGQLSGPSSAGKLHVTASLPGLLAAVSPLSTTAILSEGTFAASVPRNFRQLLPDVKPWITVSASELVNIAGLPPGSAALLTPRRALEAIAQLSTGKATELAPGTYSERFAAAGIRKLTVTVNPAGGTIRTLSARYGTTSAGGLHATLKVELAPLAHRKVNPAPPGAGETTDLDSVFKQLAGEF